MCVCLLYFQSGGYSFYGRIEREKKTEKEKKKKLKLISYEGARGLWITVILLPSFSLTPDRFTALVNLEKYLSRIKQTYLPYQSALPYPTYKY